MKVPFMDFLCQTCGKQFRHRKRPDRPVKFCSTSCYHRSKLGSVPWNKGRTDLPPSWNKGIPMKDTTKRILSGARKGSHFSPKTEFKKGQPSARKGKGKKKYLTNKGYCKIYLPSHPRADWHGFIYEHIVVAERCLGRCLIDLEVVHHIDESKTNNSPSNLYVFENNWEHLAFHARKRKYGTILKSNII